jgi:hypothetical protein
MVAAVVAVSEASTRTTLEAAKKYAEDRATAAQSATASAAGERDALTARLALAEAEVQKLRVVAASAEEAAERAKTATAATEATARDAAQTAAREKAALGTKVAHLKRDLGTATLDLATASRQFSQVTISSKWSSKRRRGCTRATPSCRRTLRVSRADISLHHVIPCLLLSVFRLVSYHFRDARVLR